ncbi:hypothetical protein DPMN_000077 [Dreissena polymorpha]|uniref:B box-type domain-containing protein n=1 Tax=Dreissena polymorpha TaxID=45954 RepID=A0A9D4RRP8_DREPO|nr:hypothetical protein DPMN_000077 [Dreissena polymorpha]
MATPLGSVHKSSDLVKDFCCGACKSRSIEEIAEIYCETCLKCFCGKCIYLHGQLYADHITYGTEDMNKWPVTKKMEDFLFKCENHKDKKLKMFCKDHSQPCCTNCAFLNHRLCKEVSLISESVKTNPSDLHELSNKIETILKELKNLQNTRQSSFQSVEGSYSKRLQEVRDVRQKLNSALDELEKATLKELDDLRTSLQAALKTDVDNCNKLMDDLELLSEAVKELADKSIGEMAFIASRKCLDKIQESQVYLKKLL